VRWAVVTGASSGIGRELARVLAREGHGLVLAARRTAALEVLATELAQAHGTPTRVVGVDLATPEGVEALVRACGDLEVEALVNNAGYGLAGPFDALPADEQLGSVHLNVTALTALTRAFLPGMRARGRGRVLNVASTAGFQPGPFMAVYYATKAYVVSLSEALSAELAGTGVTVTALCPGFTRTDFATRAVPTGQQATRLFSGAMGALSARDVAEAGVRGMARGHRRVVPGLLNRATALLMPLTPRPLALAIVRHLNSAAGR
jgi:short-subunit dehydrogenase